MKNYLLFFDKYILSYEKSDREMKDEWRKNLWLIVGVTLGFALFLKTGGLLKQAFVGFSEKEIEVELLTGIVIRFLLCLTLIYLIRKLKFLDFVGFGKQLRLKNIQALVIPLVIVSAGLFSESYLYVNAGTGLLSLFLTSNLFVALAEELAFRGIVLPLMLKLRKKKKSILHVSVFFTALIFGLIHYLNLFREPDNFSGITSQVIFATAIGVFLGGLLMRTRNILLPVLIHFLVNVGFGKGDLMPEGSEVVTTQVQTGTDWSSLLLTLGFFAFIAFGGIFMIRQTHKTEIMTSLNLNNQEYEVE